MQYLVKWRDVILYELGSMKISDISDDLSGDFISFWVNLLNVFLHEFENLPFVCCRYFDGSGNVGPFLR